MTDGHTLVRTQERLADAVERVGAAGSFALDTEFMREKTYVARLCLLQIGVEDSIFVVDPLEVEDLSTIAQLIADPEIEVLVHAGRQDFELFHDAASVLPRNVFDVQIAAGFAGYGASLPYGRLVESVTGTKLTKGESYTDWCRRPLTDAQLRYAADDVRYLRPLVGRLKKEIADLERTEWVREEMLAYESEEQYRTDPAEAWRRVTGRGTLSSPQVTVLKELAAWRETMARKRDIPRGWVMKDHTLVEIARRRPADVAALRRIRGMNARDADRSGNEIVKAVARAASAPAVEIPQAPSRKAQQRAKMLAGLADAVVRARCEEAKVATELVATRGELEALLTDAVSGPVDPGGHRILAGWRRTLAGDAVLALVQGKIGVRAIDRPPYIQEVALGDDG